MTSCIRRSRENLWSDGRCVSQRCSQQASPCRSQVAYVCCVFCGVRRVLGMSCMAASTMAGADSTGMAMERLESESRLNPRAGWGAKCQRKRRYGRWISDCGGEVSLDRGRLEWEVDAWCLLVLVELSSQNSPRRRRRAEELGPPTYNTIPNVERRDILWGRSQLHQLFRPRHQSSSLFCLSPTQHLATDLRRGLGNFGYFPPEFPCSHCGISLPQ